MADYTSASTNAQTTIANDIVEEYEVSENKRRVRRGSLVGQIEAAAKLEGLAARRSSGVLFRLAKLRSPRS